MRDSDVVFLMVVVIARPWPLVLFAIRSACSIRTTTAPTAAATTTTATLLIRCIPWCGWIITVTMIRIADIIIAFHGISLNDIATRFMR